ATTASTRCRHRIRPIAARGDWSPASPMSCTTHQIITDHSLSSTRTVRGVSVVEEPAVRSHAVVADEAAARGAYVHTVSGPGLRDKLAVLDAIADAMDFPETFGRNLDALYDCLRSEERRVGEEWFYRGQT